MTNVPSLDPADEDSLAGTFRAVLRKAMMGVDDCLPAIVIAYDRATNRATVQPQIQMLTTGGERVSRAQVASVPVLQLGAGGFVLSFPVLPGDLGWIKASDRDISLYLQQGMNEEVPNTARLHSFQDGWFIPDTMMRQVVLDGEDAERVVLQTLDGATRVAIGTDTVIVTGSARVEVRAPEVLIDSPAVQITGDLQVDGEVTGNGIALSTHTHGEVQSGSDSTGPPE
jgi:phage baseplate assembly protein gpV